MNTVEKRFYSLAELVDGLDVTLKGNPECLIDDVATIQNARAGQITFITNALYKKYLPACQATAIILDEATALEWPGNAVISRNPHFVYAKIAGFFEQKTPPTGDRCVSSVIDPSAHIHPTAHIGAHCVIGKEVVIGANVIIRPGCVLADQVVINHDSQLDANVTLYHKVKIGCRTHVSSGAVIGSDGFGFALEKGRWHRVPQLGSVMIGDDVSIGANTTIDCGAIGDTVIHNGVKLDNLIQVGHNVEIGENTIIAGCVAIAGSTVIGKNCMVGGGACFAGHIRVCDHTVITGMTAVTKSITEAGAYSSGIVGAVPNLKFRKNNARFHRLEQLMQRVKALETTIKHMNESKSR